MQIKLSDHFSYGKLLRFSLPSILMMIFTSIYGVVDGFFVSNFAGEDAFSAVNLIMPFLMICSTVGFMFGTGGSALVAKEYGMGEKEKANKHFSLLVYFSFLISVIIAVFAFIFLEPISYLLGAREVILEKCVEYGRIIITALPFFVLQLLFQSFFVTAERPKLGFLVTLLSGLANMALDALLVPILPSEYKLMGAALATAVSQAVGGIVPLVYFFGKNSSLLRLSSTKFEIGVIIRAATNGVSELMSNITMSVVGMLYNIQLIRYCPEHGVAAYGVMMYVSMIFAAAFIGYSIGTAPIFSYHDGAGNVSEKKALLKKSLVITGVFGVCMVLLSEALAYPLSFIFVGYNKELMDITVSGFGIFSLSFIFMGFAIFSSGFFTALNDGITSAIISFLRTVVFQVLAVIILPLFFDISGVWISIVVAEFMAFVLSIIFLALLRKKRGY